MLITEGIQEKKTTGSPIPFQANRPFWRLQHLSSCIYVYTHTQDVLTLPTKDKVEEDWWLARWEQGCMWDWSGKHVRQFQSFNFDLSSGKKKKEKKVLYVKSLRSLASQWSCLLPSNTVTYLHSICLCQRVCPRPDVLVKRECKSGWGAHAKLSDVRDRRQA